MVTVRGGAVRAHVQAFADACQAATGAANFGTYAGHDPAIDLAVDIFTPTDSRTLGDFICAFALDDMEGYGIDYVIYRQRIYNPEIADYWRNMEDRGGVTQNHMDHVHISFLPTAPERPTPPDPEPEPEDEMTSLPYFFDAPPERADKAGLWMAAGLERHRLISTDVWTAFEALGAKHLGVAPVALFDALTEV